MAAKGSILKQKIAEKIVTAFPGSFLYNDGKEIRINGTEEGVPLQIKITLTCAKTPVGCGYDNVLPGEKSTVAAPVSSTESNEQIPQEPTTEEKERLTKLLNKLGL